LRPRIPVLIGSLIALNEWERNIFKSYETMERLWN
jgi:hypothetical protein